jgi:hypothetical protein
MDTNNNHYQTDLNRDSVWATQQETRHVIAAYRRWNPQTFIDHHGETENFFFPPVALPVNPNIPRFHLDWLETYGRAIAAASDQRGWTYFTGETFDEFYPGYWDAYPFLKGAIGFTFETNAGGYTGLRVERDDETIITLRDGVDKHVEGGLAVLLLTAAERERKLRDYWRYRQTAIEEGRTGPVRAYVIVPGHDPARAAELVEMLMVHGIEVHRAGAAFELPRGVDYFTRTAAPRAIPAGAYVVPLDQPDKRMIQAMLEPRTEPQAEFVEEERRKRALNRVRGRNVPAERDGFYDVTAWALPYAYGVEAYAASAPVTAGEPLPAPPLVRGRVVGGRANTAYLFDPRTLGSTRLAFALLREGFKIAVARRLFNAGGRDWPLGTFVVRRERNPDTLHARVAALAEAAAVEVVAVQTAWTEKGPDLGSATIDSLKNPRLAVIADAPTDENAYGAIWFLLERRLDQPFTALRAEDVAGASLARYDVIVLPDGPAASYKKRLGEEGIARLKAWTKEGGVLVCTGGASALAADKKVGWTKARLLGPPEESEDTEEDADAAEGEDEGEPAEKAEAATPRSPAPAATPGVRETERDLRRQEERRREETEPTPGAILAADLDVRHFLAYGYESGPLPVLVTSDRVLAASPTGANVARIRSADPVLSGFAWPEAAERLRGAAYLVDEPQGRGRVVLFADDPNFRNFWRGLEKLFTNALLLGPSLK